MSLSPGEKAEERDELGYEVARLWLAADRTEDPRIMHELPTYLRDALDKLAEAYGPGSVLETEA